MTAARAGGPFDEGTLDGTTVTCPWHASPFDIITGRVRRGPATFDQPQLTVGETDGGVDVASGNKGRSLSRA